MNGEPWSSDDKDKARYLYGIGVSKSEIGRRLGRSKSAVAAQLLAMGVELPPEEARQRIYNGGAAGRDSLRSAGGAKTHWMSKLKLQEIESRIAMLERLKNEGVKLPHRVLQEYDHLLNHRLWYDMEAAARSAESRGRPHIAELIRKNRRSPPGRVGGGDA